MDMRIYSCCIAEIWKRRSKGSGEVGDASQRGGEERESCEVDIV